ncbi:hypothetical protein QBD01_005143, partial [Ochrobactrum sp. 19YEA23]|nr:hypothetical protein [Ochrobactrum sp. 19YEA23]
MTLGVIMTGGEPPINDNSLLDDRSDDACTDGAATFTDSEAELLFHGDRD